MKARLACFALDPADKKSTWGFIDAREILAWQDFLIASKAVRQRLAPERFYTDKFVDRFNDFDADAVRAQARGFRS